MQNYTQSSQVPLPPQPQAAHPLHTPQFLGSLGLFLPLLIVLGILSRKRWRARQLQQQIALLEQLWQLDFKEKTR